jgi:stage V sporulation protein R
MDDRIKGNEVAFARVNAFVTALPRVGLNPYALGMRLFAYIEDLANKGKLSYDFQKILDAQLRRRFDTGALTGKDIVLGIRENFSDFTFINTFVDQDFVDRYKLFVVGKRLNEAKGVWEYYVQSRDAGKYREMLLDSLYHPPSMEVDEAKTRENSLYINHAFEGKPLVKEFIGNTMLGISYLWGGTVKLETSELVERSREPKPASPYAGPSDSSPEHERVFRRVLYTMRDKKLTRDILL